MASHYQWTLTVPERAPATPTVTTSSPVQYLDLALDPDTGDLLVEGGDLVLTGGADNVIQEAKINLGWVMGEWFLDEDRGIPYFEQVLVKSPNLPVIQALYRRALLGTRGVVSVESLTLDLDKATRTLTVRWSARITDGTVVSGIAAVDLNG